MAKAAAIDALIITHDRQPLGDPVLIAALLRVSLEAVTADATLDKIDKQFMPGPLEVQMGIRMHFPNHDHVRYQVYPFSLAKPFGLPLNAGSESAADKRCGRRLAGDRAPAFLRTSAHAPEHRFSS